MRICVVGPTYPFRGGIAQHTTLLVQELRKEHDVRLISFTRQYPQFLFPGKSDRDPSESPLRTETEYLLDGINPISWMATSKKIRDWEPNLVIMPWWHPFWAFSWKIIGLAAKQSGAELIFICHNVLPHEANRLSHHLTKFALKAASRLVVHAHSDQKILRKLISNTNITVTPLPTFQALDTGHSSCAKELPTDRPILLFCGLVRPYKGLNILIESLPDVLAQQPIHLAIVGEFWQDSQKQYIEQITRLQLQDNISIVDEFVSDSCLAAYVKAASVVILPYKSATQSAVVQLSFGLNTPVITTSVGGLPDVVQDGKTGLVVEPDNPNALAEAINRFLSEGLEDGMRQAISAESHRFSWATYISEIL